MKNKKPKLGIDIDEILRAKWLSFDRFYADEFGEGGITEPFDSYNLKKHYMFKDTEIREQVMDEKFLEPGNPMEKASPTEYVVDEKTGKAAVDDFAFKDEVKFFTADEMFDKFLYEDYVYEIHGSAPKLYMNSDVDVKTFLKLFEEFFEIFFFARTKVEAIPSTLFFLSKQRLATKNIFFVEEDKEVWDSMDWVITTNPDLLDLKPEGKTSVKITRIYNPETQADYVEDMGIIGLIQPMEEDNTRNKFREFVKDKLNVKTI